MLSLFFFFFFNDPATTEIYTLSLHDALPIYPEVRFREDPVRMLRAVALAARLDFTIDPPVLDAIRLQRHERSEEHTSELQSRQYLVCRLLLEKKKKKNNKNHRTI